MRKHGALGLNCVCVVGVELLPPIAERWLVGLTVPQPGGVNAIARPEDMAAGDAFMCLHQIEPVFADDLGNGVGKAPVPVHPAKRQRPIRRINDFYMAIRRCRGSFVPGTREQGDIYLTRLA